MLDQNFGTHDGIRASVSSSKDKKDAESSEHLSPRQRRSKDKLIRLDDLIPDDEVVGGGGRRLFGATHTTNKPKQN